MKCFDVVRTVLDATYEDVPGDEKSRDASIKEAMALMSEQYNNHLMTSGGPNFSEPATRFGYVLKYVPAHAHWLYDLLSTCNQALAVLGSGKARITCLGGGPGSDIVGVLKLLDEAGLKCKLFCELIDGCEEWKTTWSDLAFHMDLDGSLHTDYVIHDVADADSWNSPTKISKADIITLSFFVSEIYHLPQTEDYLRTMLGKAKAGAILVVNDNRTSAVYELIDQVVSDTGFEIIEQGDGGVKIYDSGEDMKIVQQYREKFGPSKLTGQIFWRIYMKQ